MRKIVLLAFAFFSVLSAQGEFEVSEIDFVGNNSIPSKELFSIITSETTPAKFWQFLYRITSRLGKPPSYIEAVRISSDILAIQNYYRDNGFFDAKVDTSIDYDFKNKKAKIIFIIEENQPYRISKIDINGLEGVPDSLVELVLRFKFLKLGEIYSRRNLENEIQRVLNLLYDNGYPEAYVEKNKIKIFIDRESRTVSILIPIYPDGRFIVGDVDVFFEDTTRLKIDRSLIERELEFKVGELYSRSKILRSEVNLSQTGLFERVRIFIRKSGQISDSLNNATMVVSVVPRNKQDIYPSIYFSDERNAFNVGFGINYQNRNFLGGGRHLLSDARFQIQSLSLRQAPSLYDTTTIGIVEMNFRLSQPYLFGRKVPFEWGVSTTIDKQKRYTLNIVRNRLRVSYRIHEDLFASFDWDVEGVNLKFQGRVIDSALLVLYQRQLNSIFGLTFHIDRTNDIFYPTSGYSHTFLIEEAGFFPYLLGNFGLNVLPFAPYYKVSWLFRKFWGLNNSVFAFKFKVGFANEYFIKMRRKFELSPIPVNRRFFAGGSASVRGWKVRDLGNVPDPAYGGNLLIEINFENRTIVWKNLAVVGFIDAGNLWNRFEEVKFREFALAGGFGVRYLTFFGGFRFDFGFKIFEPRGATQWIFKKNGRQILKDLVFHIGVGQTF